MATSDSLWRADGSNVTTMAAVTRQIDQQENSSGDLYKKSDEFTTLDRRLHKRS
jgi:hypothetical protein